MAAIRIKISVVLYNLSKKIGGWWDDSDWYGDDYERIKQTYEKYNLIYCPLIKDVIRKEDCAPCEMCPDN